MTSCPSPVSDELVEHYKLNAYFDGETTTHISNAQGPYGVRSLKTITKWKRTRKLAEGGAGSVWLETMEGRQTKTSAVKVIAKGVRSINTGYHKEIRALIQSSRVNISFATSPSQANKNTAQ